jgi:ABC-type sugar transport system substrate-binding protein
VSLLDETLAAIQDRGLPLASTSGSEKKYGGVVTGVVDYEMGLSAGRTGGEVIRDRLPAAPRVILLDYPDLPNLIQRANGLEDGFLHSVPGAIILGRYQGATRQFAYESVAALLAAGTTFEVILSINDDGSYGAIDALVEAGIDPQAVSIISIDAQEQAQEFIAEDYFIRASLQVARTATARALVEVVVQMLAGGRVAEQIIIPPGEVVTAATLRLTPAPGG